MLAKLQSKMEYKPKRQYVRIRDSIENHVCPDCDLAWITRRTIHVADSGTVRYCYCPQCGKPGPKTWVSVLK